MEQLHIVLSQQARARARAPPHEAPSPAADAPTQPPRQHLGSASACVDLHRSCQSSAGKRGNDGHAGLDTSETPKLPPATLATPTDRPNITLGNFESGPGVSGSFRIRTGASPSLTSRPGRTLGRGCVGKWREGPCPQPSRMATSRPHRAHEEGHRPSVALTRTYVVTSALLRVSRWSAMLQSMDTHRSHSNAAPWMKATPGRRCWGAVVFALLVMLLGCADTGAAAVDPGHDPGSAVSSPAPSVRFGGTGAGDTFSGWVATLVPQPHHAETCVGSPRAVPPVEEESTPRTLMVLRPVVAEPDHSLISVHPSHRGPISTAPGVRRALLQVYRI